MARIISENMPNTQATFVSTGGSVDNIKRVQQGTADIGFATADAAYDAINGSGTFREAGPVAICAVAVLYQSIVHVVALDRSGIRSIPDLKGKRVAVGGAGSTTEGLADRIMTAAGLDPMADITRRNLSVAESVMALKANMIDAFFWIGGLPTPAVANLAATPNVRLIFLPTDQYIPQLVAQYGPLYTPVTLPKDTYVGMSADVPTIGVGTIIFVNATMPERTVHDLLKTIFDNLPAIQALHPDTLKLSPQTAPVGSSIPFHPGAITFYREKGTWDE